MQFILMGVFALIIVAADQVTKLLVVNGIPLGGNVDGIPGLFHLTYVQNTGAAFSSFQGMQWLFLLIFILFTIAIIWEFSKKRWPFTAFDRWCIAAVYAGGLGNMIDRLRLGYVVDMIEVDFISFPVFNVADCFIVCGVIALLVHLVFFNRDFWKDEKGQ
jgi:signal peptidase II